MSYNIVVGVVLMFSDEEVTVTEADGKVDLTIIKSGTNSRDVLVTYTTLDGNAIGIIIHTGAPTKL